MKEKIDQSLAALNAAWQRYANIADEQLDPVTAEALNRDYLAAWEGLDTCGIAEWMLEYDPSTLTFSLPVTNKQAKDTTTVSRNEQEGWSEPEKPPQQRCHSRRA